MSFPLIYVKKELNVESLYTEKRYLIKKYHFIENLKKLISIVKFSIVKIKQ